MQVEEPTIPGQPPPPFLRCEVLRHELGPDIAFDRPTEACYSQAHDWGLRCRESCLAALSIQSMRAALVFRSGHGSSRVLFSAPDRL